MPLLNRTRIRGWLENHNWKIGRLVDECLVIDPDDPIPYDVMRNCVNGYDRMRPGRIKNIERVTEKFGDPVPYRQLVVAEDPPAPPPGRPAKPPRPLPKVEPVAPPPRRNGRTDRPPRTADEGTAA